MGSGPQSRLSYLLGNIFARAANGAGRISQEKFFSRRQLTFLPVDWRLPRKIEHSVRRPLLLLRHGQLR